MTRLRHLVDQVATVRSDGPLPFVALDHLESGTGTLAADAMIEDKEADPAGMVQFSAGDVMFGKLRPYLRKSWLADRPGLCSSELIVMRPRPGKADSRWLAYAVQTQPFVDWAVASSEGVKMPRTSFEKLGLYDLNPPPVVGQRAIADYLDAETARLDRLVCARRETATLLEQRRRAAIDNALLCADAPGRRIRVKHLILGLQQGWSPDCEARQAEEGEWGVLKAGCANYGVFRATENKALPPGVVPDRDLEIRAGDLLVSRANTKDLLASVCIVPEVRSQLLLCDKLYRLIPSPDTDPRFLAYVLSTSDARRHIEADATGTSDSMQNISQGTIRDLVVIAPLGRRAQTDIAERLDRSLGQLAVLAASTERHIALLQERRQALITAAVTGQIEIPGVAA